MKNTLKNNRNYTPKPPLSERKEKGRRGAKLLKKLIACL
jgi:hypothetical protein